MEESQENSKLQCIVNRLRRPEKLPDSDNNTIQLSELERTKLNEIDVFIGSKKKVLLILTDEKDTWVPPHVSNLLQKSNQQRSSEETILPLCIELAKIKYPQTALLEEGLDFYGLAEEEKKILLNSHVTLQLFLIGYHHMNLAGLVNLFVKNNLTKYNIDKLIYTCQASYIFKINLTDYDSFFMSYSNRGAEEGKFQEIRLFPPKTQQTGEVPKRLKTVNEKYWQKFMVVADIRRFLSKPNIGGFKKLPTLKSFYQHSLNKQNIIFDEEELRDKIDLLKDTKVNDSNTEAFKYKQLLFLFLCLSREEALPTRGAANREEFSLMQGAANSVTILKFVFLFKNLSGVQAPHADLSDAIFDTTDLSGANFEFANMRGTYFRNVNTENTNLNMVTWGEVVVAPHRDTHLYTAIASFKGVIRNICYSPDGRFLVIVEAKNAYIFGQENYQLIKILPIKKTMGLIAFAQNNSFMALSQKYNIVYIYDLNDLDKDPLQVSLSDEDVKLEIMDLALCSSQEELIILGTKTCPFINMVNLYLYTYSLANKQIKRVQLNDFLIKKPNAEEKKFRLDPTGELLAISGGGKLDKILKKYEEDPIKDITQLLCSDAQSDEYASTASSNSNKTVTKILDMVGKEDADAMQLGEIRITRHEISQAISSMDDDYTGDFINLLLYRISEEISSIKVYQATTLEQVRGHLEAIKLQVQNYVFIPLNVNYDEKNSQYKNHWVALIIDKKHRLIFYLDPAQKNTILEQVEDIKRDFNYTNEIIMNSIDFQQTEKQEGWIRHCGPYMIEIFNTFAKLIQIGKCISGSQLPNLDIAKDSISLLTALSEIPCGEAKAEIEIRNKHIENASNILKVKESEKPKIVPTQFFNPSKTYTKNISNTFITLANISKMQMDDLSGDGPAQYEDSKQSDSDEVNEPSSSESEESEEEESVSEKLLFKHLTFSGNRKFVAATKKDKEIYVWSLDALDFVNCSYVILKTPTNTKIRSLFFNLDGTVLTSISYNNMVYLWDLDRLKLINIIPLGGNHLRGKLYLDRVESVDTEAGLVTFHPRMDLLLTVGGYFNFRLNGWLFDRNSNNNRVIDFKNERVYDIKFSANGREVAVGCLNGIISVYDINDGSLERTLETGNDLITSCINFSDNDSCLVSSDVHSLIKWFLKTREKRIILNLEDDVYVFCLSKDNQFVVLAKMILSTGDISELYLLNLGTSEKITLATQGVIEYAIFSQNVQYFVYALTLPPKVSYYEDLFKKNPSDSLGEVHDPTTQVFQLLNSLISNIFRSPPVLQHGLFVKNIISSELVDIHFPDEPLGRISCITFSNDNCYIVVGDFNHLVYKWDIKTGELNNKFLLKDEGIMGVATFNSDDHYIVICPSSDKICIFDAFKFECLATLDGMMDLTIRRLAWFAESNQNTGKLIVGTDSGIVLCWQIAISGLDSENKVKVEANLLWRNLSWSVLTGKGVNFNSLLSKSAISDCPFSQPSTIEHIKESESHDVLLKQSNSSFSDVCELKKPKVDSIGISSAPSVLPSLGNKKTSNREIHDHLSHIGFFKNKNDIRKKSYYLACTESRVKYRNFIASL